MRTQLRLTDTKSVVASVGIVMKRKLSLSLFYSQAIGVQKVRYRVNLGLGIYQMGPVEG